MSATTRDRTRDLQIFSLTLSQLSYRGIKFNLYYFKGDYQRVVSIHRPPGYEPGTLPLRHVECGGGRH